MYRWMDLPQQPQLSFVEKCFVSTRLRHRALGHTILIAKNVGKVVALVSLIVIGGGLFGSVALVAYYLSNWLFELLLNHYHINHDVSAGIILGVILLLIVAVKIKKIIMSAIKTNNQYMNESIAHKLASSSNEQRS